MCVLLCMQIYQFKIMYFLRRENPFTLKKHNINFHAYTNIPYNQSLPLFFFCNTTYQTPLPSSI